MIPGHDPYQQALEDLDVLLAAQNEQHMLAWLETARHVDQLLAAGERLRVVLSRLMVKLSKESRSEVEMVLNNWNHTVARIRKDHP